MKKTLGNGRRETDGKRDFSCIYNDLFLKKELKKKTIKKTLKTLISA